MPARLLLTGAVVAATISAVAFASHQKPGHKTSGYTINFSLSNSYTTSAGIFNSSGTLVRTLWGNQPLAAGSYSKTWDGNDDYGNPTPNDTYSVKLLTHNISTTWDGVIGNSSTYHTGPTHLGGYGTFSDILSVGGENYMLRSYDEGQDQITKFSAAMPNEYSTSGANAIPISYWPSCFATDGTRMYVGMEPSGNYTSDPNGMVMAYNLDEVTGAWTFTGIPSIAGQNQGQNNGGQWLVLGNNSVTNAAFPTSIAVQTGGNLLAISQPGLSEITFYDKLAGTPISGAEGVLSASNVTAIRWSTDNQTLWVSSGSNVTGYQYSGAGWVPATTIRGSQPVRSFAVNPADSSLGILYAGTDQQLRGYSAEGTWLYTVGSRGGYANGPAVNDTKFMILPDNAPINAIGAGVGFQPDGKVWIVDSGNNRIERFPVHRHLSAARKDAEVRMVNGYALAVDENNPDHMIVGGYMEFQRDYSLPLSAGEGAAWTLINNYGYGYAGIGSAMYQGITQMMTATNGHTYGVFEPASVPGKRDLVELTATGIRDIAPYSDSHLQRDLSSWSITPNSGTTTVYKRQFVNFDSSYNPVWGPQVAYCSFPSSSNTAGFAGGVTPCGGYPADLLPDGSFVSFKTSANPTLGNPFLGFVHAGASNFWAQTAISQPGLPLTHDGHMPIGVPGSMVIYPDFAGRVNGNLVAMFANGENYDQSEADQVLIYHSSGLPVLDLGNRSMSGVTNTPSSNMAGNASGNAFVTCSDGNMRIFHTDESTCGGIHEITLYDVNSLSVASATFNGSGVANFGQAAIINDVKKGAASQKTAAKPKGVIITTNVGNSSSGATTITDGFGRGNSSTVGNGWVDVNSGFGIQNSALVSTNGHAAEYGNVLLQPQNVSSSDQTITLPPQFTTSTLWESPYLWSGAWGLVSHYQTNGNRYFAEAQYQYWPGTNIQWALNGYWQVTIGMYLNGVKYTMAADHGYYLPSSPGHSYSLEMTTTGSSPTVIHVVMKDLTTGTSYIVLDATSDQPEVQASGQVGIQCGYTGSIFNSYAATINVVPNASATADKIRP